HGCGTSLPARALGERESCRTRRGERTRGDSGCALASVGSLTSIAAPPMLTSLLWCFTTADAVTYFPGAPFAAAFLFCIGAFAIFVTAQRSARTIRAGDRVKARKLLVNAGSQAFELVL